MKKTRQIDFANGPIMKCILGSALPMLAAQILTLLYNIVDRIYIARIPGIGTTAIGAVGLCFPIVILTAAFTDLYGTGGAPLFSIEYGRGRIDRASHLMNTSFRLELLTGILLFLVFEIFSGPLLFLFGASENTFPYAAAYLRIYLTGTVFTMIAAGMNPFINAQGFPLVGMATVTIGAVLNIVLDPVFIFSLHLGIEGAAIASVISQAVSAFFVLRFLTGKKAMCRIEQESLPAFFRDGRTIWNIISLGTASFIMQLTNALVSISCNHVLHHTGGDLYVSVMTIVISVRQIMDTPIMAIADGAAPVLSFNYGAGKFKRVREAVKITALLGFAYTASAWILILTRTDLLISIFSSDTAIGTAAEEAIHLYFSAFVFQTLQYVGQTTFKALARKRQAIFFSLLRKAVIVVPLTYLLPYVFHLGARGVFLAEPFSNVIGGTACFTSMMLTVMRKLKRMEDQA